MKKRFTIGLMLTLGAASTAEICSASKNLTEIALLNKERTTPKTLREREPIDAQTARALDELLRKCQKGTVENYSASKNLTESDLLHEARTMPETLCGADLTNDLQTEALGRLYWEDKDKKHNKRSLIYREPEGTCGWIIR